MDNVEATEIKTATAPLDEMVGKLIADRYRVVGELGRGGMGVVYKVEHITLKKFMALKLLKQDPASYANVDRIKRFQQEAKASSAVSHPNIAAVHDYGATENGDLYLVMDFVEGNTLADEIRERGRLDSKEAIGLFIQIADAMSVAHKRGLLHRDLKPSNFLIDRSGPTPQARIVDFGIAKMMKDGEDAKLTQTGEVIGSPAYMSPEQCSGYTLDERSDVYSLGCVMFESLTGVSPFNAETAVQVIFKHVNERAPSFRAVSKEASVQPELERVVLQSLEKEPQNRYQSMQDLADDLRLIQAGKNPVKEASRNRAGARLAKTLGKAFMVAGALPCLMLLAGYLWFQQTFHVEPWTKEEIAGLDARSRDNIFDAVYHLRASIKQAEAAHAKPDVIANLSLELGYTYEKTRNYKQALATLLPLIEKQHYNGSFQASVYDTIAGAYIGEDDYKSALPYAEKASELKHTDENIAKPLLGNSLYKLVLIYEHLHDLTKLLPTVHEFLELQKSLYPNEDHPYVADGYFHLGWAEMARGNLQAAVEDGRKALKIEIELYGGESTQAQRVARELISYYAKLDDIDHAKAVAKQVGLAYPLAKEDE